MRSISTRPALAAVNTLDMRDADNDVTSRRITVEMVHSGVVTPVNILVHGTEAQPYITEIYASTDTSDFVPTASVA